MRLRLTSFATKACLSAFAAPPTRLSFIAPSGNSGEAARQPDGVPCPWFSTRVQGAVPSNSTNRAARLGICKTRPPSDDRERPGNHRFPTAPEISRCRWLPKDPLCMRCGPRRVNRQSKDLTVTFVSKRMDDHRPAPSQTSTGEVAFWFLENRQGMEAGTAVVVLASAGTEPTGGLPWFGRPVRRSEQRSACCRGPLAITIPSDTCGKAFDGQAKTRLGVDAQQSFRLRTSGREGNGAHFSSACYAPPPPDACSRPDATRQAGRRAPRRSTPCRRSATVNVLLRGRLWAGLLSSRLAAVVFLLQRQQITALPGGLIALLPFGRSQQARPEPG